MRLLITSHVVHFLHSGRIYAYGPYAREIDLWAQLFSEIVIASPCRVLPPPGDCLAFRQTNIRMASMPEAGGIRWTSKLSLLTALPSWIWRLGQEILAADAVHVRCPGNVGLVASLLVPLFPRPMVAKYAGIWIGAAHEPWSYKLQRRILGSRWWRGPVTVYGQWPNQRPHVTPFFTSILTAEQVAAGRRAASRPLATPLSVVYTGRLTRAKNVDALIHAAAVLRRDGIPIHCTIIGEGPERESLEQLADGLGIPDAVTFTGGIAFDEVIPYLERCQVLVLVSDSEGWGKSVAEAMAFGMVCIGSNTGFLPEMLRDGRGITIPPRDPAALAAALADIAQHPGRYEEMRVRALAWAERFSIDGMRDALRSLLEEHWKVSLIPPLPAKGIPALSVPEQT